MRMRVFWSTVNKYATQLNENARKSRHAAAIRLSRSLCGGFEPPRRRGRGQKEDGAGDHMEVDKCARAGVHIRGLQRGSRALPESRRRQVGGALVLAALSTI